MDKSHLSISELKSKECHKTIYILEENIDLIIEEIYPLEVWSLTLKVLASLTQLLKKQGGEIWRWDWVWVGKIILIHDNRLESLVKVVAIRAEDWFHGKVDVVIFVFYLHIFDFKQGENTLVFKVDKFFELIKQEPWPVLHVFF